MFAMALSCEVKEERYVRGTERALPLQQTTDEPGVTVKKGRCDLRVLFPEKVVSIGSPRGGDGAAILNVRETSTVGPHGWVCVRTHHPTVKD